MGRGWLTLITFSSFLATGALVEHRFVLAVLVDGISVGGNTLTTQSPFSGTRIVHSGSVVSNATGTLLVDLPLAVEPTRTMLFFTTRHDGVEAPDAAVRGRLASSTMLEFVRITDGTTPLTIEWTVVEYFSGVSVQRGSVQQSSTAEDVSLDTAVGSLDQAFVTWSKTPSSLDGEWDADDAVLGELTALDTVTFRADAANAAHTIWWQVVEFQNVGELLVQRGTTSLVGGAVSSVQALPTGVDTSKSILLVGYRTSGTGSDIGARLLGASFVDGNNIALERSLGGDADDITEIAWQVIEFGDGSRVLSGSETFSAGDGSQTVTLPSTVDVARSAPIASVQTVGGQSLGRSNLNASSTVGVASFTHSLTDGNTLALERDNTDASATVNWFVVEFAD